MSGAKGKGGTGRGTDKKGWNRWQAGEKKKLAKKVFGRNKNGKSAEGENGKPDAAGAPNARSANMTKGSTAFKGATPVKGRNTSK